MTERIVVVGFGPVAARLVDELLPAVRGGLAHLTVVGEEAEAAYNRVHVADLGVGRTTASALPCAAAAAGWNCSRASGGAAASAATRRVCAPDW